VEQSEDFEGIQVFDDGTSAALRYNCADHSMNRTRRMLCYLFLLTGPGVFLLANQAQSNQQPVSSQVSTAAQLVQEVPFMDGGAGPCSLELTVTTADGRPVYDATIKVHIAYGFAGFRRLDLQAGTNAEGKVKFIGLPSRVHRPPLEFTASKDQLVGTATYDPDVGCQAKRDVALDRPIPPLSDKQ
jgi:hypothetical protein